MRREPMSHPLTIDVPEDVFVNLSKLALQQGKPPEVLAQELVSKAIEELEEDPLLKWIGAFRIQCARRGGTPRSLHRRGIIQGTEKRARGLTCSRIHRVGPLPLTARKRTILWRVVLFGKQRRPVRQS